ncbi:MAG TPA: hypothetical protein VFM20_02165, partial [Nitrososphaeraceae archaeon]|nr:hypothetical protein [Nitrososphaeraceae archaeon]
MRKIDSIGFDNDLKSICGRININKHFRTNFKLFWILALVVVILAAPSLTPFKMVQGQQSTSVTITAIVAEPKERWDALFADALAKLREKHPDMTINIDYRVLPYADTRKQILTAMAGQTPLDLISV